MGDFRNDEGNRFGGDQRGGFGGRDRRPVTMHQATCAECGKQCEVPFRPSDGKPVYCNACFGARKSSGNVSSNRGPARTDFGSGAGKGSCDDIKKQLVILNQKMDRLIKAAEVISGTKPVSVQANVLKEAKPAPVQQKDKQAVKSVPGTKQKKEVKKKTKKKK